MQQFIDKATHLTEALPYIRRFQGKVVVVKCGGAAMLDLTQIQQIMRDIALLHCCGIRPVIVHGGGPEISTMCDRLQIPTQFSNGYRRTDAETLEVVQMVLLGKINKTLVTALNQFGAKAVGISGQDANFLQAEKIHTAQTNLDADLGYVGTITQLDTSIITTLLAANYLPVIAPLGTDAAGQVYNINADLAAGAIAGALAAEKLIFLSDVNGFYQDKNDPNTRLGTVNKKTVQEWLEKEYITGGMIPKLHACLQALDEGTPSAHILDGTMLHSLLLEIFTDHGVGTLITP